MASNNIVQDKPESVPQGKMDYAMRCKAIDRAHSIPNDYIMKHKKDRGYAVIINNQTFEDDLPDITDSCCDSMKMLLISMGFQSSNIIEKNDCTVQEMDDALKEAASKYEDKDYDCFVAVISTHGNSHGNIIGTDRDDIITVAQLTEPLKGKLKGKPKIFFFQMASILEAPIYKNLDEDEDSDTKSDEEEVTLHGLLVPTEADFLLAFSSMPGYLFSHDQVQGRRTRFFQRIVEVFRRDDQWKKEDLVTMLTEVKREVVSAYRDEIEEHMPCTNSMLTKRLVFSDDGNPTSDSQKAHLDRYIFNEKHTNRGYAVIINNEHFEDVNSEDRLGTEKDCIDMTNLLKSMGFQVKVEYNCSAEKMNETMEKAALEYTGKNWDCFVAVILSHGMSDGKISGTDLNGTTTVGELVEPFLAENCEALIGKPKMFFFQACRGEKGDKGVTVPKTLREAEEDEYDYFKVPVPSEADFLLAFSVVPGYFCLRNECHGSWFIQSIVDVFKRNDEQWRHMDLLQMLTQVNKVVAYGYGDKDTKQMPCFNSMLTKSVVFSDKQ